MITVDVSEDGMVTIRYGNSSYQEWIMPLIILKDLKAWYPYRTADTVQETVNCRYKLRPSFLDIKRLDVYNLIHFVLPTEVVQFLISAEL